MVIEPDVFDVMLASWPRIGGGQKYCCGKSSFYPPNIGGRPSFGWISFCLDIECDQYWGIFVGCHQGEIEVLTDRALDGRVEFLPVWWQEWQMHTNDWALLRFSLWNLGS